MCYDVGMSDATKYTIKPLVWEKNRNQAHTASCNGRIYAHVQPITPTKHQPCPWAWWVDHHSEYDALVDTYGVPIDDGYADTLDTAKLAAESAYRKLLADHLEAVK